MSGVTICQHRHRQYGPLVVVGLGANLGDGPMTFRWAVRELIRGLGPMLAQSPANWRVSSLYETLPVGPPQPPYWNAALAFHWGASPRTLLQQLQTLEHAAGRRRPREVHTTSEQPEGDPTRDGGKRWGPRPLDLDILAVEGVFRSDPVLTLPHPRLVDRAFAWVPLVEVAPRLGFALGPPRFSLGDTWGRRMTGPEWISSP